MAACALGAPASAQAAVVQIGSDLQPAASASDAHPVDTAFWQRSLPNGRPQRAPFDGFVRSVRIRGFADSDWTPGASGGETMFHIQVLAPLGDGRYQIRNPGGTSGAFHLPTNRSGAGPDTISTFTPENLCVRAGDAVAFNTVGGFSQRYARGTPLHIFAPTGGAVLDSFEAADKTNNGDIMTGRAQSDRELLMEVTLGGGVDGDPECPGYVRPNSGGGGGGGGGGGPTAQPPQLATLPAQRVRTNRRGSTSIGLFCKAGPSRCVGTVRLETRTARPRTLARSTFNLAPGRSGRVVIRLNATGKALLRRKRFVPARLVAVTDPGGAARTATRSVTLRSRAR